MKSKTEYLWFNTSKHREYCNITDKVQSIVSDSGIQEGLGMKLLYRLQPAGSIWGPGSRFIMPSLMVSAANVLLSKC